MERDPSHYSRLLVILVLVPLLALDLVVGLPEGAFVGGGALVLVAAAGIHYLGGEPRAATGWLAFGAALGLVALIDVTDDVLSLFAFGVLLLAGLLLLMSQRKAARETAA